jgi:hypothetical protein
MCCCCASRRPFCEFFLLRIFLLWVWKGALDALGVLSPAIVPPMCTNNGQRMRAWTTYKKRAIASKHWQLRVENRKGLLFFGQGTLLVRLIYDSLKKGFLGKKSAKSISKKRVLTGRQNA